MTQPLRRLHRRMILAAALAVPVLVAIGITARPPTPAASAIPDGRESSSERIRTLYAADDLWRRTKISTRILVLPGDPDERWIELEAREAFAQSDLLLYWSAARPRERISPESRLLGVLRGKGPQRFDVPDSVDLRVGYLILYDLPHAEIFGIAEVPVQL